MFRRNWKRSSHGALKKDPGRRSQSMADVRAALNAVVYSALGTELLPRYFLPSQQI
jgi:hypothetical protein